MELFLGVRDPDYEKPRAIYVKVIKCEDRKEEEILHWISTLTNQIDTDKAVAAEIITFLPFWDFLLKFSSSKLFYKRLLKLLHLILKEIALLDIDRLALDFVQLLKNSPVFNPNGYLINYLDDGSFNDDMEPLVNIMFIITQKIQTFGSTSLLFLKKMNEKATEDPRQTITKLRKTEWIKDWIMKFWEVSVTQNGSPNSFETWRSLSLIPRVDELMGTSFESKSCLRPVKTKEPYSSPEEYMDVNYRLLRAECFSSIQSIIKGMLAGTLDPRDRDKVYHNIQVVGYRLCKTSINFCLQFETINDFK